MSNRKVTIIVPVYNSEEFLSECLLSIMTQTYENLEIILVNDGSTDTSGKICDAYATLDQRIIVIHQQNGGPSAARNRGLAHASGTFIQFVDADDTIERTMTETLYEQMKDEIDLVICGYQTATQTYVPPITGAFTKASFLKAIGLFYKKIIFPSPCNKMYRLGVLKRHDMQFPYENDFGEDLMFNLAYVSRCRNIYVLRDVLYMYRTTKTSLTNTYIPAMYEKQKALHVLIKDFLQTNNCGNDGNMLLIETIFANAIMYATTNVFHEYSPLTPTERKARLQAILQDEDTVLQLPFFTDSLQARLFRYFIKRKAYRRAYIFFVSKQFLQVNFSHIYQLLRRVNKG